MNKYERARQYFQNILFSAAKSEEYGVNQTGIFEVDAAIEALGKQIPERAIGDLNSVPHYRCPVCRSGIKTYENSTVYPYCHYCGQALDWSDAE